jgi:hypothetical protein
VRLTFGLDEKNEQMTEQMGFCSERKREEEKRRKEWKKGEKRFRR